MSTDLVITRIGDLRTGWGEGLLWDDRRSRLYLVDCAASTLHWLEGGDGEVGTMQLPSMATRVLPTTSAALLGVLDDGLHVIDPDAGTCELLAAYPDDLGGRCNDACADPAGSVITGKLNMEAVPGSVRRWSPAAGWCELDSEVSNTNGPNVGTIDGATTLIVGDTATDYYAYRYDPATGTASDRRVFGDVSTLDGKPDGATIDADGGLWSALVGGGQLARFTVTGLDRLVPVPVQNPTDVTFGGPDLTTAYVVSIGLGAEGDALDGTLLRIDGLGTGRPEPRVNLG